MSEQNIDLSQDTGTPQPQPDYTPANTTEDAILGRHINMAIEAQDGPKNANEAAATPAVTPGTNPQQSAAQGKQDGSGTGKPIGTDSAAQQQQATQGQGTGDPRTRRDAAGNVTDGQGNIIARAGTERRLYEQVERQRRYNETLRRDLDNMQRQIAENNVLGGIPKQLGLQPAEVNMGLRIVANFKRDPLGTLKYLLTETAAMGHNVNELLGQQSGVDMNAIARMIDQRLGPIQQDREAVRREAQVRNAAERQYNAFMAQHEHAATHETAIARLLQSNPQLTPEAAYLTLENFALRKGLDFSQPLEAQLLAREQGAAPNGGVTQVTPQAPNRKPVPPMPGKGGNAPVTTNAAIAEAGESWSDTIRYAMREAGYKGV